VKHVNHYLLPADRTFANDTQPVYTADTKFCPAAHAGHIQKKSRVH